MLLNILKPAVAAAGMWVLTGTSALSDADRVQDLLTDLQASTAKAATQIANEIQLEWNKSGSATADLLLSRGRKALEAGQIEAAIEHFTALTDHAPEFAEGWFSRATAFAHLEKFGPALADLEVTLKLNPDHFEAISGVGGILEVTGDPEAAYEAYELVLTIHPHHPVVTEALKRLEPVVKGRKL